MACEWKNRGLSKIGEALYCPLPPKTRGVSNGAILPLLGHWAVSGDNCGVMVACSWQSGWIQPHREDDLAQMSAQTKKPHTKMIF